MSYANPEIIQQDAAIGFDFVVETYRRAFATLPWLEKSFGRAWEQPDKEGKRAPKAYLSTGEYQNLLPNDNLKSQAFLMSRSAERPQQTFDSAGRSRDMTAVFWFDLSLIVFGQDNPSVELLRRQVENMIWAIPFTERVTASYDERHEDIFLGYIDEDQVESGKRYLMFPFAGFRIDFGVGWQKDCLPDLYFPPLPPYVPAEGGGGTGPYPYLDLTRAGGGTVRLTGEAGAGTDALGITTFP